VSETNLLSLVIQSAKHFVGFLVGRIKEVFLFCRRQKLFVRRTRAYLSYRGVGRKEKLKFGRSQATFGYEKL